MLVLHGYIDDCGKGNTFILSCLQAEIGMWTFVELAWLEMLEKVNANLRKQGRQEISRYHAADCNGLFNEFKGWTTAAPPLPELSNRAMNNNAFSIWAVPDDRGTELGSRASESTRHPT